MPSTRTPAGRGGTAFVLGGGGVLGAAEVGMLQALLEHDVRPDLVVGTSVGAIDGALVDAVLASCAVPGLLPAVEIDGEHYLDGGLVHSIPVGRAVALGADTIYVLHVGRIDRPLRPPSRPWEVATVAFEIARRHRFAADLAALPPGVTVHVLPAGDPAPPGAGNLRYRDFSGVSARIDQAYVATRDHLH